MKESKNPEYLALSQEDIDRLEKETPSDEELYDLAELFKVFGDSTRIRILYALLESEMCVGDMAQLLGLTPTACSHQLRVLKNNKLVRFRRDGKIMFYSLADDHVRSILALGMEHILE
ncbi:MAG: metalloregulator ArsR/SmtB family transcription factor [Ruminococcus sp.]|jgi:ArsR family transcriptional regulator|uniref:ArsR/SmtB family transcription factor n=1 Tax=Ruminococcus sp. TaxID=41978 RepID=UPI0025FA813E|nr:metalloregulator ArsR/SmtB family transcription factor [Ruminococcus sp.]MCR5539279.1 metalloregulator ArsR/SmtB family transcription factor [Ruminococcus sp.]